MNLTDPNPTARSDTAMTPTSLFAAVNPFYAARLRRRPVRPPESANRPVYAKLPRSPQNASPVPGLTSLYHHDERGPWGDRRYPGNCSGYLIRDLIRYFDVDRVLDPMMGSGTCRDVCRDLDVPCLSLDIRLGHDACSPATFYRLTDFPFIWCHPPYYRQKLYTSDPRDLSQAVSPEAFYERYGRFLANCAGALAPGGILAVLMGDYSDREFGFLPLTYQTKRLAFAAGLRQHGTDIIRFSHGASSSGKVYRSKFIPGLHDVCMLFEKPPSRKGGTA